MKGLKKLKNVTFTCEQKRRRRHRMSQKKILLREIVVMGNLTYFPFKNILKIPNGSKRREMLVESWQL